MKHILPYLGSKRLDKIKPLDIDKLYIPEYLDENLYGKYEEATCWAVGHTHIDVAWLWRDAVGTEDTGAVTLESVFMSRVLLE